MAMTRVARPPRRTGVPDAAMPVLLWVAAAIISGFTIRRYLEPFDEGLLLQAADRIAGGGWPYADFTWGYGPGQPLLVALLSDLLGRSVLIWRLVRVVADATIAVLAWKLAGRDAGPRSALVAWAAAACTAAQPTSANPTIIALAFGLGALTVAVDGARATGATRRAAVAGALTALAAFWRPDLGAVAGAAVVVALLVRRAPRAALAAAAAAAGGAVLLYAPFAVAAGPGTLWDVFVGGPAREGGWWSLPFPVVYDGPLRGWPPDALFTDLKDLLAYELPLAGLVALAAAGLTIAARRAVAPATAGLLTLAAGTVVYLLSRPDEFHAQPLLLVCCPLTVLALAARPPRALAALTAAVLALLLAVGVANRLSALILPPDLEPVRLPGVPGIGVPPHEAEAIPSMVALVQDLVPPGEPIYVAPRRSDLVTLTNPLVHFLTDRPNVLNEDVSLQARPDEQARIVAALERQRPRAIVRWTDPLSARPEPNPRGRSSGSRALDAYLAAAYERRARFGRYDVLVPAD
jgi:hypothetical protein